MPKHAVVIAIVGLTTTCAIACCAHLTAGPAHAAPENSPTETETRLFTEAFDRWREGNQILALQIHEPFETLNARATELIERMRQLHSSIPPAPTEQWRALIAQLRGVASHLERRPIVADEADNALSSVARATAAAFQREINSSRDPAKTYGSWRRLRMTFDMLIPPRAASWAHDIVTRALRECFERFDPVRRELFVTPTTDELILTRSILATYAELTRRTHGPTRPDFLPPDLDSRLSDLTRSLLTRAATRQQIATLARQYDELTSRRESALTPQGSLDEAKRTFEQKQADAIAARVAAIGSRERTHAALDQSWVLADAAIQRLGASLSRATAEHRLEKNRNVEFGINALANAADAVRAAAKSTSPLMGVLPGLAQQLDFDHLGPGLKVPVHYDSARGIYRAASVIRTIGSHAGVATDARARTILNLLARFLDETAQALSRHTSHPRHLDRSLDDLHTSLSSMPPLFSEAAARTAEIERMNSTVSRTATVLAAIAAITDFENRNWHPDLPRPAPASRWSLAEAHRLRQALVPRVPGTAAPSDALPELPRLPTGLRRVPMIMHSDCAPGA